MGNKKITSAEVAERAGVSKSAVSRVFTPGASASKKTTEKVRQVAHELGYRPNILARAMVSGKSRIIGMVVSYFDNQFYPTALEYFSHAFQERGHHILVFMATQTAGNIDHVIDEILDYQVDGIITASVALSSQLTERCKAAGVPIVMFNRTQDDTNISAVTSDNINGGVKVANLLLKEKYQKIGYIVGWEGASTQRDREYGFVKTLKAAGLALHSREVGNFDTHQAISATKRMFEHHPPEAVFVANDHMAIAVMDVLRHEMKMRIPEDVAVVGYDDVPAASWPSYNLTTIRQPVRQMVQQTVHLLLQQINEQQTSPKQVMIDSPLILRGTTRIG